MYPHVYQESRPHRKHRPKTIPPDTICQSTPHFSHCKSILSNQTDTDPRGYSRFSIRRSFSQSKKFHRLVIQYLKRNPTVCSLEDCQILADLNTDLLTASLQIVNNYTISGNPDLLPMKSDNVQSYLSAIITNIETCLESLQAASGIQKELTMPMLDDTKLHSISLALFTKAFIPKRNKGKGHDSSVRAMSVNGYETEYRRNQIIFQDGRLNIKMSSGARAIYDKVIKTTQIPETSSLGDQVLVSDIVVVSKDGSGNFTTISGAVAATPRNSDGSNGYFLIFITASLYEENVVVDKSKRYLMMGRDGINRTTISRKRNVVDGWTTFNSATFAVVSPNFIATNITFRNTAGPAKHQAVVVRNGADLSTFYSCSFEGYQDTLYTHSPRQFYRECDIYGTFDFIFGNAAAVFENCNIYPRRPMAKQFNAITAQGRTDPNQNTGISFVNRKIKAAADLGSSIVPVQTYLGRPWKKYSRTVYSQCFRLPEFPISEVASYEETYIEVFTGN